MKVGTFTDLFQNTKICTESCSIICSVDVYVAFTLECQSHLEIIWFSMSMAVVEDHKLWHNIPQWSRCEGGRRRIIQSWDTLLWGFNERGRRLWSCALQWNGKSVSIFSHVRRIIFFTLISKYQELFDNSYYFTLFWHILLEVRAGTRILLVFYFTATDEKIYRYLLVYWMQWYNNEKLSLREREK